MKCKNMQLEDWKEVGDQAKKAREELFSIIRLCSGHLPVKVNQHIKRAISDLDNFRSAAEEEMLKSGKSEDLSVFYGS